MTKQNNKPKLYIMCGISGSGKSTMTKQIAEKENCVIVSSDDIRAEICNGNVSDQSKNEEVFKIFHDRIRKNLEDKKNVIADATNITIKSRKAILNKVNGLDVEKIVYIMAKPYEDCIKDNNNPDRVPVPEEVVKKQVMKFQIPFEEEGLDNIIVCEDINKLKYPTLLKHAFKNMIDFDQKNPHHSMTLNKHCEFVQKEFIKKGYENCYNIAALYHDVGKPLCQTFDENGIAHYFGHENIGTYYLLSHFGDVNSYTEFSITETLDMLFLINYHMMPFNWNTDKAHNKWKRIFGDYKYQLLLDFNECDKARLESTKQVI